MANTIIDRETEQEILYNKFNAPSVLAYIEQLQGLISRMATNSANCKTCAVAVLAAVLALSNYNGTDRCLIASIPTFLFLLTDSYYLGLERRFKKIYNEFISDIKNGKEPELFNIPKIGFCEQMIGLINGFASISTTPFYILLGTAALIFSYI